jgi:hypothetical protein
MRARRLLLVGVVEAAVEEVFFGFTVGAVVLLLLFLLLLLLLLSLSLS